MPGWQGSDRRARLPKNWHRLREQVRARAGGQCEHTIDGIRCTAQGNQCDHIVRGDDHSLSNLQWLCGPHHAEKSSREGGSAPRKPRGPTAIERARAARREDHPGLLRPKDQG